MVGSDVGSVAPWWLAGSAVALWLVRETWGALLSRRKERTETEANIGLVEGLSKRVGELEVRVLTQDQRLQQEFDGRLRAQEEASRLRMRILQLESALRGLGVVIPDPDQVSA
ncbi:hypothetical protein [Stenotrophomonas sp.]|uniref:hypothetical protein n=1 Tax=Stenotrophomonas sp. TaxID=69392 RepID=UPI0028990D63|nr:hypothetical protein [Stenotrophomonas sp.]